MKVKIVDMFVETDVVNGQPKIVYKDVNDVEWVHSEESSNHGGFITILKEKSKCWYWQKPEKTLKK